MNKPGRRSLCMSFYTSLLLLFLTFVASSTSALDSESTLLLSFRNSINSDQLKAFDSWKHDDLTPCTWNGVVCGSQGHVTELSLPSSQLKGSLNSDVFLLPHLRFLDLSNNMLSGKLPEAPVPINLQFLNLSYNVFAGALPGNFFAGMTNLSVASLESNLFSGSLPPDLNWRVLRFLNVSCNKLSGAIPAGFAEEAPVTAIIDISFNNFTGATPPASVMMEQKRSSFAGNTGLCGLPTVSACQNSSPALAAIPNTTSSSKSSKFRPSAVIGIVAGDFVGVVIVVLVFFHVCHARKLNPKKEDKELQIKNPYSSSCSWWGAVRRFRSDEELKSMSRSEAASADCLTNVASTNEETGTLVTVDGSEDLHVETLFRASACVLGTSGSSILYKAILEDGTTLAVRRIGEGHVERFSDFENQVRMISKLAHPNLVRIRGFYWGLEEKLVIYDFVPIGTLGNTRRRATWEERFRIAKGVARGVAFLHDKRHVHGNLKPSNIFLEDNMEPRIGDFGLESCGVGELSGSRGGSARTFGSRRSMAQHEVCGLSPSPSFINGISPYQAPESLRALKADVKWDVYSYGVILLELLTGKVVVGEEMDDQSRALKMADVAIRADVEGKEEMLMGCFKLGYNCACTQSQRRPSMKEVVRILEELSLQKFDCK